MSCGYDYQKEKAGLFTEEGSVTFTKVRDEAFRLNAIAGCFRADKAMKAASGSTWIILACLDRMVELGEIIEITAAGAAWGQHRIFKKLECEA